MHEFLVKICQSVHEISCKQALFWFKFLSSSPAVTLKIRSRSPKPNQLFNMSQCYIFAKLVKIWQSVHEISCKQESITAPTPTGSTPKTICPPPLSVGGHNNKHQLPQATLLVGEKIMGFQDYFSHFQLRKSSGWGKNKPKNHWSCIAHDRGQVLTTEDRLTHSYWILKRHLIHPLMNSLKTNCLAMELVARH